MTVTLQVGTFATLVSLIVLLLCEDRLDMSLPPPRSVTVQVAAETETAPPTSASPGSENLELAAPGEASVTADPPADQPAP